MKRIAGLAGSIAALVALGGSALAGEKLTVIERATTNAVVDVGAPGDSEGDILTFHNDLFDPANQVPVGRDNGWCVRIIPGSTWECAWTNILAGGQITVQGPFLDQGETYNTVTGGTGIYAGVRGEMRLRALDDKGTAYEFAFDLIR